MQIREQDGVIYIRNVDERQKALIQSFGVFKWDRKNYWWYGAVSREVLNRLAKSIVLPSGLEQQRKELNAVQDAVDAERMKPDSEVKPLVEMPVKANLYTHQIRAVNMCLMHFGLILDGAQNAFRRHR